MSRLIEANEASRNVLGTAHPLDTLEALRKIHDVLWPRTAPAQVDWDTHTAEQIANIIRGLVERNS